MPEIDIDNEVLDELKSQAEPFIDTPNSVIRRLLGLDEVGSDTASSNGAAERRSRSTKARGKRPRSKRTRAPKGSLLPGEAYELPILEVLAQRDGRAPTSEVVAEVGRIVDDQLTDLDRQEIEAGGPRWKNRVQFARLRLVQRSWLVKGSPRGMWEITDEGRAQVSKGKS